MKKVILLLLIVIICIILTSCVKTQTIPFTLKYDETRHSCIVKNISDENYFDLKVIIQLKLKDNFNKEITQDIGELEAGAETIFDITEISEDTQLEEVILKSYTYDSHSILLFLGKILLAVVVILVLSLLLIIIAENC